MGKTASDIINKALSFVGISENPPGSNNVIFNTHYYGREINNSAYHWCVAGIWDTFRECGASDLFYDGNKTASCTVLWTWAIRNHLTVSSPMRGDLILFDWNGDGTADHIGIIINVRSDGTLDTVEFNVGDAVKEMHRTNKAQFLALIRPAYDPEPDHAAACNPDTCPIMRHFKSIISKEA